MSKRNALNCRRRHFRATCLWTIVAALLLGLEAPAAEAVKPFNGRDLSGWKFISRHGRNQGQWLVGTAKLKEGDPTQIAITPGGSELINVPPSLNLYSEAKFGDCRLEIEVLVPKGANSGIYLMGNYEVQVLDSFGKKTVGTGDMGAIYDRIAPKVNASKAPGQWQKFVIDFRAPRFDQAGNKIANAKLVKCTLNGQVIHENVEIEGLTGAAMSKTEVPLGPIMLQGDHGPIAYRNIVITPLDRK